MFRLPPLFVLLSLLLGAPGLDGASVLYNRTYRSPVDGASRPYDVRTPTGYDGVTRRPAVLFLHGRGGGKGSFQTAAYQAEADARGMVLVFWQGRFVPSIGAFSTQYIDGANGIPDETDVLACLRDASSSFAIDAERIHLVGFSQGGKGALLIGLKNPDLFASISDGSGPSDAFQGQLWAPNFPDYRSAAGGDHSGASAAVLSRWYAQSPRFYLENARNVPIAFFHGASDTNVPDSTTLFPYRNTHHIADTPGFSDARGRWPTISELRQADPEGYSFQTSYPAGVDHDEELVLAAKPLFDFFTGKSRAQKPRRVVAITYDETERSYYWARLSRATPNEAAPAEFIGLAETGSNSLFITARGSLRLTLLPALAGLDPARPFTLHVDGGSLFLRLVGAFPGRLRITQDGFLLREGIDFTREGTDVTFSSLLVFSNSVLVVADAPAGDVAADDLLVPALVEAPGQLGAQFSTEVSLANLSSQALRVEALLMDGGSLPVTLEEMLPYETRLITSKALFALFQRSGGAFPLRLRIVRGIPGFLLASSRVFNTVSGGGTYGLSFPVLPARDSVLNPGEQAYFFGASDRHPSRINVSLYAPFEECVALLELFDPLGGVVFSERISLPAGSRVQRNGLLDEVPVPGRVSVTMLAGRSQVYGTVISNSPTNDPFRSPALLRTRNSTAWTVPAVAAAPGRNGALFTSDLFLGALPGVQDFFIPVNFTFRPRDGSSPLTVTRTIIPGTTRLISDLVGTLFPAFVPAAGALEIRSAFGLEVLAVTRSDSESGPSSQDVATVRAGEEITSASPAAFVGVAESDEARSNLVLVNEGPASTVTLEVLSPAGINRTFVELAAGEIRQLDSFLRLPALALPAPLSIRSATLLVLPAPGGRVVASVARIDNRTNDPAGITPVPIPAGATFP